MRVGLNPVARGAALLLVGAWCWAASHAHAATWEVDALLEAAQASHPLVGARQAERAAAQADLASANWQRYPSVSVELAGASAGSGTRLLRLDQPLWNGGRIAAGIQAADSRLSAAQTAIAETRQELRLRVVTAANEALRQQARRLVALDNLAEHDRLLAMIRRRVGQEVSPVADQRLAESRQLLSRSDVALAEQGLQSALTLLSQLAGQAVTAVLEPAPQRLEIAGGSDAGRLAERALDFSPMLRRMDAQIQAADADIVARQAQVMPQVLLRLESSHGRAVGSSRTDNRALLVLQAQPGAGLSALSAIDAAVAQKAARQAERDGAEREVRERLQLEWNDWSAAVQRSAIAEQVQSSAAEVSESYARQYVAGRKTWLDVLNAVRESGLARLSLLDTEYQARGAAMRLQVLSGDWE